MAPLELLELHRHGRQLAEAGEWDRARSVLESIRIDNADGPMRALIANDLGVVLAMIGDANAAAVWFQNAIMHGNVSAVKNLEQMSTSTSPSTSPSQGGPSPSHEPLKIAVLSFLFNWPSTGGGITHTVELVQFLRRAGYEVELFHPRFEPWGIGRCDRGCPINTHAIGFDDQLWNTEDIKRGFRAAVDKFRPDAVIITDSWNFKPHLADAVKGYPYLLRMQALECICPLNNLRFLMDGHGNGVQCHLNQLTMRDQCVKCLASNDSQSGKLHRLERTLSGVATPGYHRLLLHALLGAEAVLVLNRTAAGLFESIGADARVVTWGMDSGRFPRELRDHTLQVDVMPILFAGLPDEAIKGFDVLRRACDLLWQSRRDFSVVVTADQNAATPDFIRFVGWKSQSDLVQEYLRSAIVVVPSIAQDGLSRTSVEAMACRKPVVASNIGGLPDTVTHGVTGFLFEPGNASQLAHRLDTLLSDEELRHKMGGAGRNRFEQCFDWNEVINSQYAPLLSRIAHKRHRGKNARTMSPGVGSDSPIPAPDVAPVVAIENHLLRRKP